MNKQYYTYIVTNYTNSVLYTGITSDLSKRIFQHKNKLISGFTSKYNVNKLVYYEVFSNPEDAIYAEKKIKAGSRKKKMSLIKSTNSQFKDLSDDF